MSAREHAPTPAVRAHAQRLAAQMVPMTPEEITAAAAVMRRIHARRIRAVNTHEQPDATDAENTLAA